MGCAPNMKLPPLPKFDADIRTFAGVSLCAAGIFVLGYDGQFHQLNRRSWGNASVALPDGRGNLFCLHSDAAYSLPFTTNLCTYTSFKDMSGRWSQANILVRRRSDPDHVICFHNAGVYRIKVHNGGFKKLHNRGWPATKAAVLNPDEPDFVYIFGSDSLYKASLADGSYNKVVSGKQSGLQARAAVYLPKQKKALVFTVNSICHVDLADGSSVNISDSGWPGAHAAVLMKDDPDMVLVDSVEGTYHVNVFDGSYNQVGCGPGAVGWCTAAFAPMGEDSFLSCRPYREPQPGSGGAMGCESSVEVLPTLAADIHSFAGAIFRHDGIFLVGFDGKFHQVSRQAWAHATVALPDGRGNVFCLHETTAYSLPFATNLATYKDLPRRGGGWSLAQVLVRQPSDPDHFICFHYMGIYKIKVHDGRFSQISTYRGWNGAQAAVLKPEEPDVVYIFDTAGLYKVSLAEPTVKKVASGTGSHPWSSIIRAAVYLPKQKKALVFQSHSICHMDLADGSSVTISKTGWPGAKAAVLMKHDPDTVLVVAAEGLYHVNVLDGSYKQVGSGRPGMAAAFAPLGEDSFLSYRPCRAPHPGSGYSAPPAFAAPCC